LSFSQRSLIILFFYSWRRIIIETKVNNGLLQRGRKRRKRRRRRRKRWRKIRRISLE
jgi:hypothetical protein